MRRGGLKKEQPEDFEFRPVSGADTTYTVLKVGIEGLGLRSGPGGG